MKYLFLIRHAKSSWSKPALSDFDRPLNKRGKRDAPFMGRRLKSFPVKPQTLMASPAKRARKTARAIGAELGFAQKDIILRDELYTFEAEDLLEEIRKTKESITALALVGHNYAITESAEWLTGVPLDNIPTCGFAIISIDNKHWSDLAEKDGQLVLVDYPKMHRERDDGG